MSDTERLAEIEARANAAARGPWKFPHRDYPDVVMSKYGCLWNPGTGKINDPADAEFIAHARSDVPYLLDRVRTLTAENERLREERDSLRWWLEGSNAKAERDRLTEAVRRVEEAINRVDPTKSATIATDTIRAALADPTPGPDGGGDRG